MDKPRKFYKDLIDDEINSHSSRRLGENPVIQEKLRQIQEKKIQKRKGCRVILALFGVCMIVLFFSLMMLAVVEGNSMRPSFLPGDRILVLKRPGDYKRNEVVLVEKEGAERICIKRIIGIPGDEIMITEDGDLLCNGNKVETDKSDGNTYPGDVLTYPIKLGKQEYFVLGDNREKSADSRTFGVVHKEELKGKVILLFWRQL